MASSKTAKAAPEASAPQPRIYIGPDIPGLAAFGQAFLTTPNGLTEHIRQCPALGALLIPANRYAAERGSARVRACNAKALEYLRR